MYKKICAFFLIVVFTMGFTPGVGLMAQQQFLTTAEPKFFYDGEEIFNLVSGDKDISATIAFTNTHETQPYGAVVYLALFERSNGRLQDCASNSIEIDGDDTDQVTVSLGAPDSTGRYYMKLFAFENNNSLIPIREAALLEAGDMEIYRNESYSFKDRAADLVVRMDIREKAGQLNNYPPEIERLGVKRYSYQQEAIHGWARGSNKYTIFPMPIVMGATWNVNLIQRVAEAISDEARGRHNSGGDEYLNAYAPTINLARDPAWGRTEEVYSEDPYQMSQFAVAFIKGLQGENPQYLKTSTSVKHFAANNFEYDRRQGDSVVDPRSMYEYYLPAFRASIMDARSRSVMTAYNAINGVPANVDGWLQQDLLRGEWGFDGFVTSDSDDIPDTIYRHKLRVDENGVLNTAKGDLVTTFEEVTAYSVRMGMDNDCGYNEFKTYLPNANELGYITEADLDIAARRVMETRILYGEFDTHQDSCEFNSIEVVDRDSEDSASREKFEEHNQLARQVEREGIVLLKNQNNALPLDKTIENLTVIGPFADNFFWGGYTSAVPWHKVELLDGIRNAVEGIKIVHKEGTYGEKERPNSLDETQVNQMLAEAVTAAQQAETAGHQVILAVGTEDTYASEGKDAIAGPHLPSDPDITDIKQDLRLPEAQRKLIEEVLKVCSDVIIVLTDGNPVTIEDLHNNDKVAAILETWHGGQEYGNAVADILFGDYSPSGKVPQTYYTTDYIETKIPHLADYTVVDEDEGKGKRLYMYADPADVVYPFGYGLSYTTFDYSNMTISKNSIKSYEDITVTVDVKNTGGMAASEAVQLYVKSNGDTSVVMPNLALKGFEKIYLEPGQTETVTFTVNGMAGSYYNAENARFELESGEFDIMIGASSDDVHMLSETIIIDWVEPEYEGFYRIVNKSNGLALEVNDQVNRFNGASVTVGNYYGYNNHRWIMEQTDVDSYRIRRPQSQHYLDVRDGSLQQWELDGNNQAFQLSDAGDGYVYITHGGKKMGVDNGSVTLSESDGDGKKWMIVQANDSTHVKLPPPWQSETKVNIEIGGQYLTARNNNYALTADKSSHGAFETFYIYDIGDNKAVLRAFASGKYFSVDQETGLISATSWEVGDDETFQIESIGGDSYKLKTMDGSKFIGVSGGKLAAGQQQSVFTIRRSDLAPNIDYPNWEVSASHGNKDGQAANAIDRAQGTRWSSEEGMKPGMWFKIDLRTPRSVSEITMDSHPSGGDYPRGYYVEVSTDDLNWTEVKRVPTVTEVNEYPQGQDVSNYVLRTGEEATVKVPIDPPVTAQYIRITQTGTVQGTHWSMHEIYVNSAPIATSDNLVIEAEEGEIGSGATVVADDSASNGSYVNMPADSWSQVGDIYGGMGFVYFRANYASQSDAILELYINGELYREISFVSTDGQFKPGTRINIPLETTYLNTIKLVSKSGEIKLDNIEIKQRKYVKYEAEDTELFEFCQKNKSDKASGGYCIGNFGDVGDPNQSFVEYVRVEGDEGGTTYLDLCYSVPENNAKKIRVYVNDKPVTGKEMITGAEIVNGEVPTPITGDWENFVGHIMMEIEVTAGANNTIRFESCGPINLDYFSILR